MAVEKGGLLLEPVFYFYVDGCENVGRLGEREHGKEKTIPWPIYWVEISGPDIFMVVTLTLITVRWF